MIRAGQELTADDLNITTPFENQANAFVNTTSTSYVTLSGGPSGTFVAPRSGAVWVHLKTALNTSVAGVISSASYEIRTGAVVGSGTVVQAATRENGVLYGGIGTIDAGQTTLITDLTSGATYNIQMMYKTEGAATANFDRRSIGVQQAGGITA